jgi:hypothetical protein
MNLTIAQLATFAQAAYSLNHQGWSENPTINDTSPYSPAVGTSILADITYKSLIDEGWQPLDLIPESDDIPKSLSGYLTYLYYGMRSDGFFINNNAAALVMRKGDTLVIFNDISLSVAP